MIERSFAEKSHVEFVGHQAGAQAVRQRRMSSDWKQSPEDQATPVS